MAIVAREKKENRRKENIINKLHLDKNEMRKKLKNFGIRTKNEESRNKKLMRVIKKLMVKIRAIEKSNCENKNFMPKNTSSKGKGMEKVRW